MTRNYYSDYKNLHENVISACDCIKLRPCNKLKEEIEDIKINLENIFISDWEDSIKNSFETNRTSCINDLDLIISSIESDFIEAEDIYKSLLKELDNLKEYNDNLQNTSEPELSNYKVHSYDENNKLKISYNHSKYNSDLKEYKELIDKCETFVENINNYLNNLENINGNTNNDIKSSFSFANNNLIFNNLFSLEFEGNNFYATLSSEDVKIIKAKCGKQKVDQCLNKSIEYCRAIDGYNTSYSYLVVENQQTALQIMANEIGNGNSCVAQVNGKGGTNGKPLSRHFVAVVGIKSDAVDTSTLNQDDFLILDPAGVALQKVLNDGTGEGSTERYLVKGSEVTYQNEGSEYILYIKSEDCNQYLQYEGVSA